LISRESAILQLVLARGIGRKTLATLLDRLVAESYPVQEFVAAPANDLIQNYHLKPETVDSLKESRVTAGELADQLEAHEVTMLLRNSEAYPTRLVRMAGNTAPPVIFVKGDASLLERRAVGFCGARSASRTICDMVQKSAAVLGKRGFNVIGGYAFGVDIAAHLGALMSGGVTTFVLATGILHFSLKTVLREQVAHSEFLVISEFSPRLGWSVANAMQRNWTICGLADAIVIADPGTSGGTFEAAKVAMTLERPLFIIDAQETLRDDSGYDHFVTRGTKVIRSDSHGNPDLVELFKSLQREQTPLGQISLM
jgi:DNA processing protein